MRDASLSPEPERMRGMLPSANRVSFVISSVFGRTGHCTRPRGARAGGGGREIRDVVFRV